MSEVDKKILVFSKHYSKLGSDLFITLRRRKQCKVGSIVTVLVKEPKSKGKAECLEIIPIDLGVLSDELLVYDTDTSNRKEAMELLQSFYRITIDDDSKFYLHLFVWCD